MKKNILNTDLKCCCCNRLTGFFRDGYCRSSEMDYGNHLICAIITNDFLEFSRFHGNDLATPRPEFKFPGLKPGDNWCICVLRWKEAFEAGVAPPIKPEATHQKALEFIKKEILEKYYTQ